MEITLEQIDELRNRVNVTYEEAKSTLEKNDGDLIRSIIELEKRKGTNDNKKGRNRESFTSFVDRLLELRCFVKNKNGDTLINVPLVLVLITFVMAFWVVIFGFILSVLTSCKIKIYRDKNSINVHGIKKNVKETVDKIKIKSEEIIEDDIEIKEERNYPSNDEENEIIVE